MGLSSPLFAQSILISIAPPPLPVYEQPPCPGDGYLWIPGYWAYEDGDYFWVPGYWYLAPGPGLLWTPGWWGFEGGGYRWHAGYWGPHVGFYGGINYGFGYYGSGFVGGRWQGGNFHYNTAVWRVNPSVVHNTYVDRTVINNRTDIYNRTSFNGPGGNNARPTAGEEAAAHEQQVALSDRQRAHEEDARRDINQRYSNNRGNPHRTAETGAGEHYEAEHHQGGHPQGEHHQGGHPQGEHHQGGHPQGEHHQGGHPQGEHHQGGHPQGGHPQGGHPQHGNAHEKKKG
jgi:hypothetical protein